MTTTSNIEAVRATLPAGVRLVAVSKFHAAEAVLAAYAAGQRDFGESYVGELLAKRAALPADIRWHFIGHLQTNKVRLIAPFIHLIHSVDSLRLINEIQKQGAKNNRVIDILLELHLAHEATKSGFLPAECTAFLEAFTPADYPNVRLCGLMTMATNTTDEGQIAREFGAAADYFHYVKERFFATDSAFCERSWGMSDDYPVALSHEATLVRIGTKIFGERKYT